MVDWAIPLKGGGPNDAIGMATAADGTLLTAGWFNDSVDFGAGAESVPGLSAFVARLDPTTGADAGSFTMGTASDTERACCIAVAPDGTVVVVGTYYSGGWASGGGLVPVAASAQALKTFVVRRALP
jgi:hypothetical protein